MIRGVIANRVTFSNHALREMRVTCNVITDDKKRGFGLVFGEQRENLVGVWRIRAVVEGQRDLHSVVRAMVKSGSRVCALVRVRVEAGAKAQAQSDGAEVQVAGASRGHLAGTGRASADLLHTSYSRFRILPTPQVAICDNARSNRSEHTLRIDIMALAYERT